MTEQSKREALAQEPRIFVDAIYDNDNPPPVLVKKDHDCEECGRVHDIEVCPWCGSYIDLGFGIAFGSYGTYAVCMSDDCEWFHTEPEFTEEELTDDPR